MNIAKKDIDNDIKELLIECFDLDITSEDISDQLAIFQGTITPGSVFSMNPSEENDSMFGVFSDIRLVKVFECISKIEAKYDFNFDDEEITMEMFSTVGRLIETVTRRVNDRGKDFEE